MTQPINNNVTNGASSSESASDGAASERFPEPPRQLLTILRTFMDTQQRRVNLWNEYDEAMEVHVKASGEAADHANGDNLWGSSERPAEQPAETTPAAQTSNGVETETHSHDHVNGGCGHTQSGHYQSTPLPLSNPDLMTRIISLVTSGLLDCAHETRAIALELASPSSQQAEAGSDGAGEPQSGEGEATDRARLSRLVNAVQDCENVVLRSIVQRDQARVRSVRPTASSDNASNGEGVAPANGDAEDDATLIGQLDEKIRDLRQGRIAELMEELRGEMADLELGA